MPKEILQDAALWMGAFDLSGSMNAMAIEGTTETQDCTTFGDPFRTYVIGPKNANFSGAGYLDTVIDKTLFDNWGLMGQTLTMAKAKPAGNIAYVGNVFQGQYSPAMTYGEVWAYTLNASLASRSFARGRVMHNGTLTTTGTGTIIQLRSITAGKSAFATLHVIAPIGGTATPTFTGRVESDDAIGFPTPQTRVTFTPRTTVGAEIKEIPGPITPDQYWRVAWTISGTTPSFIIVMALGFEEPV